MDSQRWWVSVILYGQLHIIQHVKENHHGNKIAVHHITVGGGCCRGRDRRRTDGVAADQQSCNGNGSGTVCLLPGNVPIKTSPPDVQHHPSGEMPDLTVKDFALALGLAT